MPNRISAAERKLRAKQLAALMASAIEPEDALDQMTERYGWSRHTRQRYLRLVYTRWSKDRKLDREAALSTAFAQLNRIIRGAEARQKLMIEDVVDEKTGAVVRKLVPKPDPDFSTALSAVEAKSRLLQLTAPDKLDVFVRDVGPLIARLRSVVIEKVTDPVLAANLVTAFVECMEAGTGYPGAQGQLVEAVTVKAKTVPPNGTNGVSHG